MKNMLDRIFGPGLNKAILLGCLVIACIGAFFSFADPSEGTMILGEAHFMFYFGLIAFIIFAVIFAKLDKPGR